MANLFTGIPIVFLARLLTAQVDVGETGLFAGRDAASIKTDIHHIRLAANGTTVLHYQLQNLGDTPLLASDVDGGGAMLRVVIRDANGVTIPQSLSQDAAVYGLTKLQILKEFWFVIPKGHSTGSTIEVNPGAYRGMKVGSRYAVSLHLSSQPDKEITREGLESVAARGTRILNGEFESEPVWITVEPPCCNERNREEMGKRKREKKKL